MSDPGLALHFAGHLIASAANLSQAHAIPRLSELPSEALAGLGRAAEAGAKFLAA